VQTGLDVIATTADRVQTGLDVIATAADRVQTGLDVIATAADRVQTGLDAQATAADRIQTGLDASTATTQAGIATVQAGDALISANNAAASASTAASAALNTPLTGFTTGANTTILSTDTTLEAFGKTQGQINERIGGTVGVGQVAFGTDTKLLGGDNGLTWDNVNKRLGIGTNAPDAKIQVFETGAGNMFVAIQKSDTTAGNSVNLDFTVATSYVPAVTNYGGRLRYTRAGANGVGNWDFMASDSTGAPISRFRIFNGGNVLIQNGGTFTDAGFRLDVNGSTRFNGLSTIQGTTASDSGQLGTELLTTGTGDASWTGSSFATGYTHVAGSTTTLTSTLAGVVNNYYQITYTVTNRTAGSFTIAFGGFTSGNLTATGAVGPRATSTDTLVITPTSDFNGTIVLSIRVISASSASVTFTSSAGTVSNQIRISSSSTNLFFGINNGVRNTTGNSNTFVGSQAGIANTTGSFNTFIGERAGVANETGNSNSFIGRFTGFNNTIGLNNSFFGQQAGFNNTTGNSNSFVGQNAGFNNTTGANNTFVGVTAGFNNTTGGNNSFFGQNAGFNNTTGGNNSFVGRDAGRFLANGSTSLTIANNSVFLGVDSRANADNETNQIVIGHTAIGAGSNTATLGNTSIVDTILRGRINLQQYATGSRPAYVKGALIYDSTLSKLVVGGATDWEVVTSV